MDARIGTVALPRARRSTALPWTIAGIEGLVLIALAVGILLARSGSPATVSLTQPGPRLLAHSEAVAMVGTQSVTYGVSGTGPGLTRMAHGASFVESLSGELVTGTGPGLAHISGGVPSRPPVAVTGTGPGLVQVARQS
jgi:hypothetical protein